MNPLLGFKLTSPRSGIHWEVPFSPRKSDLTLVIVATRDLQCGAAQRRTKIQGGRAVTDGPYIAYGCCLFG
jgi:hypothetical protein